VRARYCRHLNFGEIILRAFLKSCGQKKIAFASGVRIVFLMALAMLPVRMVMAAEPADALAADFQNPPDTARPRVWWHWMNGNITEDGIAKDLQWMHRIGLGGVQNFDASLSTPQIVERRLIYMSPEWKDAFRFAAKTADELNLELGIASSPGWSETGGPWVAPQDAMKKLVWSSATIIGGKPFHAHLPQPPANVGPYQDIRTPPGEWKLSDINNFYRDVIVLAYRTDKTKAIPRPVKVTANQQPVDAKTIFDSDLSTGIALPSNQGGESGTLEFEYAKPQTVRSLTLFVTDAPNSVMGTPLAPSLEAIDERGRWKKICDMNLTAVPTTASFSPITARKFRLVFNKGKRADTSAFAPAPGVDVSALAQLFSDRRPTAKPMLVDLHFLADSRVNAFEQKAGFTLADNYYDLGNFVGANEKNIATQNVIDISSHMSPDGTLDWTPPAGQWTVLRLGYSLTGTTNHPATAEATGLEVDKYDADAIEKYLTTYLGMYRDVTGNSLIGAHGLRAMVTDSTEVGASNWTPKIIEQFKKLRGYDPTPWLPALTGQIIESRQRSDAFLYDFRRTLAQLTATEHYGTVSKVAHKNGLTLYGESLEGMRATLGDDIEMRRFADLPMAALWAFGKGKEPAANLRADLRGAASAAHIYGQNLTAAESLTSILTPWAHAPADLQPMIDVEFLNGVNRPVIHTSVHQPVDDKVPGLSLMVFGQFFTRHETWAEMAKPWVDYIARNSYLLQQGHNVADVAYFYGEETPVAVLARNGYFTDVPTHYAYDFMPPDAVLNELGVDGSDLVAKSGARYKALYLSGTSQYMTLPVLRKLAAFAEAGATIVGFAPKGSPSLADDAGEFMRLTKHLWSGASITTVGKGRVIASGNIEATLADSAIAPDFSYAAPDANAQVQFVHRRIADGDIYYVANRSNAQTIEAHFRVSGKAPEIWRADSGAIEPVSYRIENKETIVPLAMNARESFFVVFKKPAAKSSLVIEKPSVEKIADIEGAWDVAFQANRGAPEKIQLPALASLSEQSEPGVKYFSGVSTYTKTFDLPKSVKAGQPLWLDLGNIGDVAEVRVNGKLVDTVWKAPYRLDIGKFTRANKNALDIRVANLWVNRLIGDRQPGAKPITFTTIRTYTPRAPLRPSGLIGPVSLWALPSSQK
jgi:hypothetical protein